jgi:hypothetical protein
VPGGSFPAEALIEPAPGTFPVAAYVVRRRIGKFNVSAWIGRASFRVDAVIRAQRSFPVDAAIVYSRGSFTVDAVVYGTGGHFSVDARMARYPVQSFTVAASLIPAVSHPTGSFTAWAYVYQPSFTVDARLAGRLTVDAVIRGRAFSVDAVIRSRGFDANAVVIRRGIIGKFNASAVIQVPFTAGATFSVDAFVREYAGSFSVAAFVGAAFRVDAMIVNPGRQFSVDAVVGVARYGQFGVDAVIARGGFAVDAVIATTRTGELVLLANLFATRTGTLSVDARIAHGFTVDAFIGPSFRVDAFIVDRHVKYFPGYGMPPTDGP